MTTLTSTRVIRTGQLAAMLSVSRITIWRWERAKILPGKTQYGPNTVGWTTACIDSWWATKCETTSDPTAVQAEEGTR